MDASGLSPALAGGDGARVGVFLLCFLVFALMEVLAPHRPQRRRRRWRVNVLMLVLGNGLVRLVLPLAALGAALWAAEQNWGLLAFLPISGYVEVVISVILLDIAIYWQHRLFHRVPLLWRLHRIHHGDSEVDVTTGIRFHPLELLVSMLFKMAVIVLLGAPVIAVLLFEIVLSSCALFNHSNIRLWDSLEMPLRKILITPSLHRIHHSTLRVETDSNFGFSVPWWDHLFGSFRGAPSAGEAGLKLGLAADEGRLPEGLGGLMLNPFQVRKG